MEEGEIQYVDPFKTKWRKYREIYVRNMVNQEISSEGSQDSYELSNK